MGGPKTKRLDNSMTAPQPGLTGPSLNILQSIFGGQGGAAGGGMGQRNPMAGGTPPQMGGGQMGGMGGGGAYGNMQNILGMGAGQQALAQLAGGGGMQAGQNVLNAYQPLFQRNLDMISGQPGARFSSGNDLMRQRALQDYNAFAGNTMLQGQQQGLQAALGLGGMQGQQMQQLLATLFGGGGMTTPAAIQQTPGLGQQLMGLGGTLGGFALGGPFGGVLGQHLFGGGTPGGGGSYQGFNPNDLAGMGGL